MDNAPIAIDPYSLARLPEAFDTNNDNLDWQITATPTKGAANVMTDPLDAAKSKNDNQYPSQIIINEILANPLGQECDQEFIELKNTDRWAIDLNNWQIGDDSGAKYAISGQDFPATIIEGNGFFVLSRSKTGLALNNSGREIITLYQPNGNLLDSTEYAGAAPKNQSWSRNESGNYLWSLTATPGKENIITTPNKSPRAKINCLQEALIGEIINFDGSDSFDPNKDRLTYAWNFGEDNAQSDIVNPIYLYTKPGDYRVALTVADPAGETAVAEMKIKITDKKSVTETAVAKPPPLAVNKQTNILASNILPVANAKTATQPAPAEQSSELAKIKQLPLDSQVTVKGLVAVEPNILGKTVFYLDGVQIYSYYQDWPELKLGDYLQVTGVTSQAGGEIRIKTKNKNDMIVLEHRDPPTPRELSMAEIGEETEGWLAKLTGELTEIHGDYLYFDDGAGEAKVYLKDTANLDTSQLMEGQRVSITGIISQTESGYRVLPRYQSDIEVLEQVNPTAAESTASSVSRHNQLINYLSAAAIALLVIIIGLIIRNKKAAKTANSSQI